MSQSIESPDLQAEVSWLDAEVEVSRATYQAYQIMYYAFIALPAVAGLDKFFHARLDRSTTDEPLDCVDRVFTAAALNEVFG
jgi:hypothetical protein